MWKVNVKSISVENIVRPYNKSDLDDVLLSWERAVKIAHPFLNNEFLELERYNIPNVYLPNTETWVVEREKRVIGFISLIGNEVGAIFVQPEFHGSGAGRALMDKAQELHGDLEVEVFKANLIGCDFYSKYGFELINEKTHQQTGNQLLRLRFTANKELQEVRQ